jgi:hypothetical protein
MELRKYILLLFSNILLILTGNSQSKPSFTVEFLGDTIPVSYDQSPYYEFDYPLSEKNLQDFYNKVNTTGYQEIVNTITRFREEQKLDDWLFYQLVRRTAQQLCPKAKNYNCYTLYKWFLLTKSGYNAILRISETKILFYIQSDEMIYNIPFCIIDNKQFICLNYHDYGNDIDFEKEHFSNVNLPAGDATKAFTYKVTSLPEFNSKEYVEKDITFNYSQEEYHFHIKVNPEVKKLFTNYPVADYSSHFNIPLSKQTYNSLIPALKDIVGRMNTKNGIDYLMHFTRYAFLYERDTDVFGREKRLSAEETLLYDYSDCEDRAALFFCLVKEIYNLPMIVLVYPKHVSIAVEFEKPIGQTIVYNGKKYSVCEPTPQRRDLPVGKQVASLRSQPYEIAFEYVPGNTVAGNFHKSKD